MTKTPEEPRKERSRKHTRRSASPIGWATLGVVTAEVARNYAVAATFNEQLPPIENIAVHYTGDFSAAFVGAQVLESTLLSRIQNPTLRRGLAIVIPAAGMTITEATKLLPIGTPDLAQMPAGIVGLAAYLGLVTFLEHRADKLEQRNLYFLHSLRDAPIPPVLP